jgi:hypothetical protein
MAAGIRECATMGNKGRPRKTQYSSNYKKKPFESTGARSDVFASLYMSMLTHPAFKDMKPRTQILYLYCKAQLYAEKNKAIVDGEECFSMNRNKWKNLYELYTNPNSFYKDMDILIGHGFVDCVSCGAISRTKNLFRLSARWQKWGTPDFTLPNKVKTISYMNKEKKFEKK